MTDGDHDSAVEPVAVVGIGCRLPGGVTNWESLWRLLESGTDAIGPIPPGRWDVDRYYAASTQQPGRMNTREGGRWLPRPGGRLRRGVSSASRPVSPNRWIPSSACCRR
jgi:hypothetical protein